VAVEVLLVLSQTGFCVAYLIYVFGTLPPLLPFSGVTIILAVVPLQVRLDLYYLVVNLLDVLFECPFLVRYFLLNSNSMLQCVRRSLQLLPDVLCAGARLVL
jgi:hypothetical protein